MRRDGDHTTEAYGGAGSGTPPDFSDVDWRAWPAQWHPIDRIPSPLTLDSDEFTRALERRDCFYPYEAQYRLGDPGLPIAPYREEIVATVLENQASVFSSPTGSGKSTQLGVYLLEAGLPRIFVTQPRIVAARELKERAEFTLGEEHKHLAGYMTGNAKDSDCGPDARLIYVTEQLLFKMANRGDLRPDDVVINDEAHERTTGTVLLLGLMKDLMRDNPDMRLIISSATIDEQRFADYLRDPQTRRPAPVVVLPGRTHPVQQTTTERSVGEAARRLAREGKNVLAFEPGRTRMQATWSTIKTGMAGHEVHMLHGDLSAREQKEALDPADHHHIVANRVGETSLTPEGKDVVVDSGLSNLGGYEQGVRVLRTEFSSQATMIQRMGRVGRTKPGQYIEAVPEDTPPPPTFEERERYDPPDIQNSSVASYVTELLHAGRRIEDLDLIEEPTDENLQYDYRLLRRLGAIAVEDDEYLLTDVGRHMIQLPLDSNLARMVVEARRLEEEAAEDVSAVRLQVAAIAAMQQVNGILNIGQVSKQRYRRSARGIDILSKEQQSDVLFELDVFTAMYIRQQELMTDPNEEDAELKFERLLNSRDISPNRFEKALRTFEEVCRREGLEPLNLRTATDEERNQVIGCQITGAEELFVQKSKLIHLDVRGYTRRLGRRSTIAPIAAGLIVGQAFNRRGLRISGGYERRFITGGSVVTPEQLLRHVPERIEQAHLGYGVSDDGRLVERRALYFDNGLKFHELEAEPAPNEATREFLITAMMTGRAPSANNQSRLVAFTAGTPQADKAAAKLAEARELNNRSRADLRVDERHQKLVDATIRKSLELIPLDVTDPAELDAIIPNLYLNSLIRPSRSSGSKIAALVRNSPDGISVHIDEGKEWMPVTYRNSVAYVTIRKDQMFHIRREDFAELEAHHGIKIRWGKGDEYLKLAAAFKQIEAQRNSPARLKREQRRAERESHMPTPAEMEADRELRETRSQSGRKKEHTAMKAKVTVMLKRNRGISKTPKARLNEVRDRNAQTSAS